MRYTWQVGTSPIQEIIISGGKNAPAEAIIFSPAEITDAVAGIDKLLTAKGLHVSYDIIDNRPALRVGGFKQDEEVLGTLRESTLIAGQPKTEELQAEKRPFDKFIGAAIFYQIGNVLGFIGNLLRKDKAGMTSDGAFITGDTTMLAFGRKSVEEKQIALMQGFSKMLQQNGIAIEKGSAFAPVHTQDLPGTWNGFRRFMFDKVVGIKAASEVVAGLKKVQAGINQGNSAKSVAGALIASGFAAGALIPEKTPADLRDEYEVENDDQLKAKIKQLPFFKRILVTIQRTPLILSGLFSGMNNVFSVLGAIDEKKYFAKNGESRKQTEIKARLSTSSEGEFEKSVFGVKTVGVKLDDSQDNAKYWTADGAIKKAQEALKKADQADTAAYSKALDAVHKAEQEKLSLRMDQDRLKEGRFGFNPKNFWMFDVAQAVAFFIGNVLYANSPKGGNAFDRKALSERFFSAVATQIATTPEQDRDYVFAAACQYAGDTRELGVTVREAQAIIGAKVKELDANPWLKHRLTAPQHESIAVQETVDHPDVVLTASATPPELLDMSQRDDKPLDTSHAANVVKQERPTTARTPMDHALTESSALAPSMN